MPRRHDRSPATLRRAIAFIDEQAHQDISMADIAAACGVTIRAVQLAFHRHLHTTPTRYLRRIRLDHAHRQLLTADPERDSMTAVSYQWGFASSSRSAAYYRSVYGVSPSSTSACSPAATATRAPPPQRDRVAVIRGNLAYNGNLLPESGSLFPPRCEFP